MIEEGELILLYHSENTQYLITLPKEGSFSTHKGMISLSEIKNKNFGDKILSHTQYPFYILRPTLKDLAMKAKRKTTIIYPKDAGFMLLHSIIFPGAKVLEVGTGSGAFTIILANFVRPMGRVYSYEIREEFIELAKENLKRAHLIEFVQFIQRDVAKDGFSEKDADCLFIDVAEPWQLVRASHSALKGGGTFASISPNMEQVQKTVRSLELEGFVRIKVFEILEREIMVRLTGTRPKERGITHTAYLVFAQKVNRETENERD
ncbi:MAG: tRNA (adenine-N1)-methyltransferase [candidate division WOR-3 bacterium]